MADASVATPGSTAESGTPVKPSASKDRSCPYCHTYFTSSSLGRHLDLFIKEKNPKPPDGIHDIEQIRRSRGNITRRQARTSSARREGSTSSSTKPTPFHDQRSPSIARHHTNGDHSVRTPLTRGNRAGWEATGVINDIPPATTRDARFDIRREPQRRPLNKTDITQRKQAVEDRDRGHAAELALKEVLDSLKVANAKTKPVRPFPFDFFAESFAALCLRCLSCPSIVTSSKLVPNSMTWPVGLPGQKNLEVLRQRVNMTLQYHRKLRRDAAGLPSNGALGRDGAYTNNIEDPEEEQLYHNHVNRAFELWNGLSETQQREEYNTESLRAFAREQKEHGETHLKLARAEDEVANLRLQLQRLNTLEQPREFLLFAPDQLPVSSDAAALVAESSADTALDYDHLIAKWKTRIETSRNTQRELPLPETSISASGHHLNGLSSYDQHPSNGDPLDDDLIDAPGDEDDELGQQRMPTAAMDRGMLDPKLRGPGQDEVMQGIESDGDGYVGGRLLADLHEYGGINRRGL